MPRAVRTRSGRALSGEEIDHIASRAEAGVDLAKWKPRRGRPPLEIASTDTSPRIAVRVPRGLHQRVADRAAKEGRTVSEVVRDLLAEYAERPS